MSVKMIFVLLILACFLTINGNEHASSGDSDAFHRFSNSFENLQKQFTHLKQTNTVLQRTLKAMAEKFEAMTQIYDSKLEQMTDTLNQFTEKLDQCHTDINVLKDFKGNNQSNVINVTVPRNGIKRSIEKNQNRRLLAPPTITTTQIPPNQIAFSVELSHQLTNLGHHHPIVYDKILLNSGNGYNKNDGIFTAPVNGIYVFTWTVMGEPNTFQGTELVRDGSIISYSYSSASASYDTASKTVVLELQTGNEVWIRTDNGNGGQTLHSYGYNSFVGFLLYMR